MISEESNLEDRSLTDSEVSLVREQISARLAEGAGEEQLSLAREELSRSLGVIGSRVNATAAWVKIYTDRATPDSLMQSKALQRAMLRATRLWRELDFDDELLEDVVLELLDDAEVEVIGDSAQITQDLKVAIRTLADNLFSEDTPKTNGDFQKQPRIEILSDPNRLGGISGEDVDYRFRSKLLWHGAIEKFLDTNIPRPGREKRKVFCMPGVRPETEVAMYRRLGFRNENIFGIEGGRQDSRQRFDEAARSLGINSILGRLHERLPELPHQFDVVNLDWLGGFCYGYVENCRQVPLADTSWVILNMRGSRESGEIQSAVRKHLESVEEGMRQSLIMRDLAEQVDRGVPLEELQQSGMIELGPLFGDSSESVQLAEIRDSYFDQLLVNALGSQRHATPPPIAAYIEDRELNDAVACNDLRKYFSECGLAFVQALKGPLTTALNRQAPLFISDSEGISLERAPMMLSSAYGFSESLVHKLERYGYASEASSSHAPYLSCFAEIHKPTQGLKRFSSAAKFVFEGVYRMIRDSRLGKENGLQVKIDKLYEVRKNRSNSPGRGSKAEFVLLDRGKEVASIRIRRLLSECDQYLKWHDDKYRLDRPSQQMKVPRKWLTEPS